MFQVKIIVGRSELQIPEFPEIVHFDRRKSLTQRSDVQEKTSLTCVSRGVHMIFAIALLLTPLGRRAIALQSSRIFDFSSKNLILCPIYQ